MTMKRMLMIVAAGAAALAMATACTPHDSTADVSESDSSSVEDSVDAAPVSDNVGFTSLTVVRSGGFAGITETVEIAEDGSWSYTKARMAPETGTLSDADATRLWELLGELYNSDVTVVADDGCADAFTHTITAVPAKGEMFGMAISDCATASPTSATNLIDLVVEETPL